MGTDLKSDFFGFFGFQEKGFGWPMSILVILPVVESGNCRVPFLKRPEIWHNASIFQVLPEKRFDAVLFNQKMVSLFLATSAKCY